MKGVAEACKTHDDMVWFMDADVVLMEPCIPIMAVWCLFKAYYPKLDILFARDRWSVNTGVWIVDCQCPTALKFLDLWHTYGHRLGKYREDLMDQVFLYYVLEVGNVWKYEVPKSRVFNKNPILPWNNFSTDASQIGLLGGEDDTSVWTTEACKTVW